MTNGHDTSGGMGSSSRDVHENVAKSKEFPKAQRPVVCRDDKKTEALVAKVSTPGQ